MAKDRGRILVIGIPLLLIGVAALSGRPLLPITIAVALSRRLFESRHSESYACPSLIGSDLGHDGCRCRRLSLVLRP